MSWTIPYTFANQSGNVPVSEIDSNFSYTAQSQQQNLATYAVDTGSTNAYAATYTPAPTLVDGLGLWFRATSTNTSTCTFNANGLGATTIYTQSGTTLNAGIISTNQDVYVVWNSTLAGGAGAWMAPFLNNPSTSTVVNTSMLNLLNNQYLGGF